MDKQPSKARSRQRPAGAAAARLSDEPNMSDATLLVKIEDVINGAFSMGIDKGEKYFSVNFKKLHSILYILASNLQMLERMVEVRMPAAAEKPPPDASHYDYGEKKKSKKEKEREKEKEKEKKPSVPELAKSAVKIILSETEQDKADYESAKKAMEEAAFKALAQTPSGHTRIGSVEVVTQSRFEQLEKAVEELQARIGPVPLPTLPTSGQMIGAMNKGTAGLSDVMTAMQLAARIKASETAVVRLTELMDVLVNYGMMPPDLVERVAWLQRQVDELMRWIEEPGPPEPDAPDARDEAREAEAREAAASAGVDIQRVDNMLTKMRDTLKNWHDKIETLAKMSLQKKPEKQKATSDELKMALNHLREELQKSLHTWTDRSANSADMAYHIAQSTEEKMNTAMNLDSRVTRLQELVNTHSTQLKGLDYSVFATVDSFKVQITQLQEEMKGGLGQLDAINCQQETLAVMELKERYELLETELDNTTYMHRKLTNVQHKLNTNARILGEAAEVLRDEKANKDEVADGLRDKANVTQLIAMLKEAVFEESRVELSIRIQMCYEKLRRMDSVWMEAVHDYELVTGRKALNDDLFSLRYEMQKKVSAVEKKVRKLARVLGDPKAAVTNRQLDMDATCASCKVPVVMDATDPAVGAPKRLPAIGKKPETLTADELCILDLIETDPEELKKHVCRRWVGGSHTVLPAAARQARVLGEPRDLPPEKVDYYVHYSPDGKIYRCSRPLLEQPCEECYVPPPQEEQVPEEEEEEEDDYDSDEEMAPGQRMRLHTYSPGKLLRKTFVGKLFGKN